MTKLGVNKATIKKVKIIAICPACKNNFEIDCWSPQQIHQDTHLYECPHCYIDIWWNIKVQLDKKGMPKHKRPISRK